jgi:hypothetical protein
LISILTGSVGRVSAGDFLQDDKIKEVIANNEIKEIRPYFFMILKFEGLLKLD